MKLSWLQESLDNSTSTGERRAEKYLSKLKKVTWRFFRYPHHSASVGPHLDQRCGNEQFGVYTIKWNWICGYRSKHTFKNILGVLSVLTHIPSIQGKVNTNYKLPIIIKDNKNIACVFKFIFCVICMNKSE